MAQEKPDNLNLQKPASENCSVCQDLLLNIQQFFDMLGSASKASTPDWLTVDDIAKELKISKSIVYRIIRSGELGAINIVNNNGQIAQKGHYRVNRKSLNEYLDSKKVRPLPNASISKSRTKHFPKVKNYLGL